MSDLENVLRKWIENHNIGDLSMRDELEKLLKESAEKVRQMTPEQREEMYRKQRESYVRAEMSWPKAKFKMIDGVKVYDSYEDYLND